MTKTQAAPFTPFEGHRRMTPEDAAIFETAAEMLIWPDVHSALNGAGGDLANHYYFSQQVCTNRPVNAWAGEQDHETVVAMLRKVGEGLK